MTTMYDDNDRLSFNEEENNLCRIESILDGEIENSRKRKERYHKIVVNKEYNHIDDKFEYLGIIRSCEAQIEEYAEMKGSPYFGRMDVSRNGGQVQTFYVGHNYLTYKGMSEIVSWKSPLGGTFYQKSSREFRVEDYCYELFLRRAITIRDAKLLGVNTEYDIDNLSLDGEIIDPFLISVLRDKRRNHRLTDIIRTIQENQNDIIRKPLEENFVVQGCAGSGKTMILLHRLSCLIANYPKSDFTKWCILTPNEHFNFYIKELSQELDIEEIKRFTVEEYYIAMLRYLLPQDFLSSGELKAEVKSEKTLDSNMLAELYSLDFRNRLLELYDGIWTKTISSLHEKGFDTLVKDFVALVPQMNFKLPDVSNHKVSTYGTLLSVLHTMSIKIREDSAKYEAAKSALEALRPKIDEAKLRCDALEENMLRVKSDTLGEIKDAFDQAELEISNCEYETDSLKDEIKILNSKRIELTKETDELSMRIAEIDKILSKGFIFDFASSKGDWLSAIIRSECQIEFDSIVAVEQDMKKVPVYNFGKRNGLKMKLIEAKRLFENKARAFVENLKGQNLTKIKAIASKIKTVNSLISSTNKELEAKEASLSSIYERRSLLTRCQSIILECKPIDARNKLVKSDYSECHPLFEKFVLTINAFVKAETEFKETFKNRDKQLDIIAGTEAIANRKDMLATIDDMREFLKCELDYKPIEKKLLKLRNEIYIKYDFKTNKKTNYRHKLYINLLMASLYFDGGGILHNFVSIDEAQDIAITEYLLFRDVLGKKCRFNLYGDVNQLIYDYKGITDWDDVSFVTDDNIYFLNENYRNTVEITEYCNDVFFAEVTAIGLSGDEVVECDLSSAIRQMAGTSDKQARRAVIYKRGVEGLDNIIGSLIDHDMLAWDSVDVNLISVIPVEMAKGLEFESVIVISNHMTENEKYISFTRALETLFVTECGEVIFEGYHGDDEDDFTEDEAEYVEGDEAKLLEKYSVEYEDNLEVDMDNVFDFEKVKHLPVLPERAAMLVFEEGIPYVATFFADELDLAKKFMRMGLRLRKTYSEVHVKASRNYIGFANPKPNDYCLVYVSKPNSHTYSVKFKHDMSVWNFKSMTEEKMFEECDGC